MVNNKNRLEYFQLNKWWKEVIVKLEPKSTKQPTKGISKELESFSNPIVSKYKQQKSKLPKIATSLKTNNQNPDTHLVKLLFLSKK